MRHLVSVMLVIVAVIHLLPLSGILGAARLSDLYGITFDEPNIAILMRHRAVLFGLLGSFLLVAVFRSEFQIAAFIAGFVSVASFMYLAWSVGSYNTHIARVFAADIGALVCLVIGAAGYVYLAIRQEG
ncbi:MAG: phosphopantetheine adenylyltransferase [Pseudanabaena sp. M046S1SP1A06QC]|nr:phosphopantetheine adenylyltransferase [Pseudanabaena sp. M046S1SP1A06QC]